MRLRPAGTPGDRRRWRSGLLLVPFGLSLVGTVSASDPDEFAPLGRIDRGLTGVMWMIKNAEAKLRNDVQDGGATLGGTNAGTPALNCCSGNLEKMRDKLDDVVDATDELSAEIAGGDAPDAETMEILATLESQVEVVLRSIQSFETAPDKAQAQAGVLAMTGAFLRAHESAQLLFGRMGYERPADNEKDGRESQ